MVKRLYETGMIREQKYSNFMMFDEEHADVWKRRLGLSSPVRKEKIGLSNLVDKAMELYDKKLITYEKLEYLLGCAELEPADVGIVAEAEYQPPTDEELDAIMEE